MSLAETSSERDDSFQARQGAGDLHRMHASKVDRIASQLRRRTSSKPVVLHKKAVSHQVPKAHDPKYRDEAIDVSDLTAILEIDVVNRRCVAEAARVPVLLVVGERERRDGSVALRRGGSHDVEVLGREAALAALGREARGRLSR